MECAHHRPLAVGDGQRLVFRFAPAGAGRKRSLISYESNPACLERRSREGPRKLTRAIENRAGSRPAGEKRTSLGDVVRLAYLRSTPSAGTLAGGAATHINGFINAAAELGAQVRVISNDRIASLDEANLTLIDPE